MLKLYKVEKMRKTRTAFFIALENFSSHSFFLRITINKRHFLEALYENFQKFFPDFSIAANYNPKIKFEIVFTHSTLLIFHNLARLLNVANYNPPFLHCKKIVF